MLPCGENGGAKIFVLELLRCLAELSPDTQFILLTQASTHEELAAMDCTNIRRQMVIGQVAPHLTRSRLHGHVSRLLSYLPGRLRNRLDTVRYKLRTALRNRAPGSLLRDMHVNLLFCPFTAPTYFEPGIPVVSTIYDLQYKTYPHFFSSEDIAHREQTFIETCQRSTVLTAISDYSRNSAITHGNLAPEQIRTIYLRMAQRVISRDEQDKGVVGRLGLMPKRYLMYPANFWKHKNHELLLIAFNMACHEKLPKDIKLVCTGAKGERQDWLIKAAHNMGLDDRILFPGYLPNTELAALMTDCTGVIFPSLYEGFGLPVIEAMAAGVPVACSNVTSLPEVAADAAIFFDPRIPAQIAQAITILVADEEQRLRLILAGQQRAREFSDSSRMAREYWDLFQHALTKPKHGNLLTGVYADGWVGSTLNIQVAPAKSLQTLEIELSAPAWLPYHKLLVQINQVGEPQGRTFEIIRGTSMHCSTPLEASGGHYEIKLSPTFIPACFGRGCDQRELSAILQQCTIKHIDGKLNHVFFEKVSA